MRTALNTRPLIAKAVLWCLVGVAAAVAVGRLVRGLGAVTALTNTTPWGLWIGFDVLAGVALAAGGFVIAGTVHIFHLRRFEALVRPAILTAFLGYVAVVLGLLADLGRPWNIWRMMFWWQPDSPLFEVGWCVMLYLTVLALEFAPVAFEGLRWNRAMAFLRRFTLPLVIAGIGLSTLHQSSLGTLFLLTGHRMHPLWYSPILPVLFLVSAIGLGLCMVALESLITSWLYRREAEWPILKGVTRAAGVVLGLYVFLRIGDLAVRGTIAFVADGTWASALFLFEIAVSAGGPLLLFTWPRVRDRGWAMATGAGLAVGGFVLNRASVGGLAHLGVTGDPYVPALSELAISLGVVAAMGLVFLLFVERFPVWHEPPSRMDHFARPFVDSVSRVHFGSRWFGLPQLGALGFVAGAVIGLVLLETTTADGARPRPTPIRQVRSVHVTRLPAGDHSGVRLRKVSESSSSRDPVAEVQPALLIDGDQAGHAVLFAHRAHQERLGGLASCSTCHHRNRRLDQGTPCSTCHADMYRVQDTFGHEPHVRALGGNASCDKCHRPSVPRARATSTSCDAAGCHGAETHAAAKIQRTDSYRPGMAPGYRVAMHGLCIPCHRQRETAEATAEPVMSRCGWCHGSPGAPAGRIGPATVVAQREE